MTIISPDEFDLLMSLSGYELNLQATNIAKKYGLGAGQILAMLPNQPTTNPPGNNHQSTIRIFHFNQIIVLNMTPVRKHHKDGNKLVKQLIALDVAPL